jgi:elongation factor G
VNIRNVALVGHGGSGKTATAEALLYVAGKITRVGTVTDGNTVMDFEPEEIERQISLGLGVASIDVHGFKVNIIDTPGYADFVGDARAALRAADMAVFVVSAVDGVEVQTELLWEIAGEEGIARAVFVNKLDRERSSFSRTLADLKRAFGKRIAPIQVPIGEEDHLEGIVRVVSERAYTYSPGNPKGTQVDLPEGIADMVHEAHQALVEAVVETDDELMEAYFEGREPTREKMVEVLHRAISAGDIDPVIVGSAHKLVGIDTLAEFIVDFAPNPLERPVPPLDQGELTISADGETVAYVFKTTGDQYVGRINMFRVFSGSVRNDQELESSDGGRAKMTNLFAMHGKDHTDISRVDVGDIAAVAKLEDVRAGATLRSQGSDVVITPMEMPRPVHEVTVTPHSNQDDAKLSTALAQAQAEDPTIRVERRAETKETVMAGLGETHIDVTLARIARKYGVSIDTDIPRIPYRETIQGTADVEGKHKKQSGGRGQFGVAFVRFEPNERGAGYEFVDAIKGGSIPRSLIPAVDKGIREALERGILAGYPVIDVRATVYDGKFHSVDSDEMSFRMAGIMAVREAAQQLRPTILEPIAEVIVRVPEDHMGDVIGDINAKRGRVLGMDGDGKSQVVRAEVPMGEMQRYSVDLRSMTGGRGSYTMEFSHYDPAPPQEIQKVVAAAQND